jgi:hypothetical protein
MVIKQKKELKPLITKEVWYIEFSNVFAPLTKMVKGSKCGALFLPL